MLEARQDDAEDAPVAGGSLPGSGAPPRRNGLSALIGRLVASQYARKSAGTFLTRISLLVLSTVLSVVVARVLGPAGRGLYAVAALVGGLGVQFGNLGLHASNTYRVARDRSLLPALLGNSLFVGFVLGGVGSLAVWALFQLAPQIAPLRGALLVMALGWVPLGLALLLVQNLLLGVGAVRAFNLTDLLSRIFTMALIGLAVLVWGRQVEVEVVFAASLLALAATLAWALGAIRPLLGQAPMLRLSLFRQGLGYGGKAYLSALFGFLAAETGLAIVKYRLGEAPAGHYSVAVTLARMVHLLPISAGTILFPHLSAMGSDADRKALTGKVAWAILAAMLAAAGALGVLAGPAIRLLFGREFLPGAPALAWMLPGIVALAVQMIFMNYFASIGMPWITVYCPLGGAVLNVALGVALVDRMGIAGPALALSVSSALMLAGSLAYFAARTRRT